MSPAALECVTKHIASACMPLSRFPAQAVDAERRQSAQVRDYRRATGACRDDSAGPAPCGWSVPGCTSESADRPWSSFIGGWAVRQRLLPRG